MFILEHIATNDSRADFLSLAYSAGLFYDTLRLPDSIPNFSIEPGIKISGFF